MKQSVLKIDYINPKTKKEFHLPLTVFKTPQNDKEYSKLESLLDDLIDEVRDDEAHPLAIVMEIIGENMEQYDNKQHPSLGSEISATE